MKKIMTGLMLFVSLNATVAQTFLVGGANLGGITKDGGGNTEDNNFLLSFNAGLLHRFNISNNVNLESGVLITGKGAKAETYFNGGNDYVKSTFNPIYAEIPLNAVLKVSSKKGSGVFVHAGPYLAVGVAGKSKVDSKLGLFTSSSNKSIQFSNDDPFTSQQDDANYNKLKRFDYGLNFGAGFELGKTLLRVNYGLGLAKINSTESNNNVDDKNKLRTYSLSIAFPL